MSDNRREVGRRALRISEATFPEIAVCMKRHPTLILPVGSLEQHGHHLPIDTDARSVEALAELLGREREAAVAPAVRYGYVRPTRMFPGSVGLAGSTFVCMIREIVAEYLGQGFKKLLVLNGHFENLPFIAEALDLAVDDAPPGSRAVAVNWWDVIAPGLVEELFGTAAPSWAASHAGVVETSLALAIAPDRVRSAELVDDAALAHRPYYVAPRLVGDIPERGVAARLSASSAAAGEQLRDASVKGLVRLIDEVFGE